MHRSTFIDPAPRGPRYLAARFAALMVGLAVSLMLSVASASMLDPGAFLVTTNNNHIQRYSLTGTLLQDLLITGLPGTAAGPAVLNNRLFVGAENNGTSTSFISELNPATGAVINTFSNPAMLHLHKLGQDGTNLLALDPVNAFDYYKYSADGTYLGHVAMTRPFAGGYQSEGIAGDGTYIFTKYNDNAQEIVTNLAGGAASSYFSTGVGSVPSLVGLAYNHVDHTFWTQRPNTGADAAQFRHYDLAGNFLGSVLAPGGITGLEILPVPEPSSLLLAACGAFAAAAYGLRRAKSRKT